MKVSRGDVVLLPIAFVSGQGTKVRPAVVLQNDTVDQRDVLRKIGTFSPELIERLEVCIKVALGFA